MAVFKTDGPTNAQTFRDCPSYHTALLGGVQICGRYRIRTCGAGLLPALLFSKQAC